MKLKVGAYYKQYVISSIGYEVWQFTGQTRETPYGLWYCMESDRGFEWFDDVDLEKHFTEISYLEYKILLRTLQND